MWPFDQLRKRKHGRRYKAALIVYLAVFMFDRLDPAQRALVEAAVDENLRHSPEPPSAWRRWAPWDAIAALRAAAMEKLGIEPSIIGMSWKELFNPWRRQSDFLQWPLRGFDNRPSFLTFFDFYPMDGATAEAKEFLRSNGIDVPKVDAYGPGDLDSIDGTGRAFFDKSGLRKLWTKRES